MSGQIEDARIRGIEKQICFLKSQIRKEAKKNTIFFLFGIAVGLLMNILFLLRF